MKRTPEEEERAHAQYVSHCNAEIDWYLSNGRWPDRIKEDKAGSRFVIGDWSWNRNNPSRQEFIEGRLPK